MNNIKLAEALKQLGHGLVSLGEALAHGQSTDAIPNNLQAAIQTSGFAAPATETPVPEKKTRAKKNEVAITETKTALEETTAVAFTEGTITKDQVRDALLAFAGKSEQNPAKAKELLARFQATRVGDLKESFYPEFLKAIAVAESASALE